MTEAVIVSTARTPLCKSWRGALNNTHGAKMGGHVVHAALERARVDADEVEDVIIGCATPEGATGGNIARQIALAAGCPITVSGMTVNRFCSSGLQTIALAAQRIIAGEADVYVAGGVESISCVQNEMNTHFVHDEWLVENKPEIYWSMLQTAEQVARTLDWIRRTVTHARSAGVRVMVTAAPHYQQYIGMPRFPLWSRRPHDEIGRVALEAGARYLDSHEALRDAVIGTPQSHYYYHRDMHFNPRGYALWARAHVEFLRDPGNDLLPASFLAGGAAAPPSDQP